MREPKAPITNIIGKGTSINGKLKVEGSIHIDGIVDGNVETTESIIVGKSGVVNGEIHTKDGLIGGKINGNIFANGRLEFQSGSMLMGDMKCKQLVIEEGVMFNGNCKMSEKATPGEVQPQVKQSIHSDKSERVKSAPIQATPIFTHRSEESKNQPPPNLQMKK